VEAYDAARARERATVVALSAMGSQLAAAALDADDAVDLVVRHTSDLLDAAVTFWIVDHSRSRLTVSSHAARQSHDGSSSIQDENRTVVRRPVRLGVGALGRAAVHGVPDRLVEGNVCVTLVPIVGPRGVDGVLEVRSSTGGSALDASDLAATVGVAERLASSLNTSRLLGELQHRADHDELTGLPNRAALVRELDTMLGDGDAVTVVFVDIDRFKDVNDALGHGVGDDVLRHVARRIRAQVRHDDFVARFGGDEFVVVARGFSDDLELEHLLDRLTAVPDAPVHIGPERVYVSLSAGIARRAPDDDADSMLRHADVAMYRAKVSDSRRWEEFTTAMQRSSLARLRAEADLHEAIRSDQLFCEYQPILTIGTGRSTMREALVRWNHPRLGRVAPDGFVPAAELSGLIVPMGAWVLRRALEAAARWPDETAVSVNVSARQLADRGLPALVLGLLDELQVDPARLVLEITETAVMADPDGSVRRLDALHAQGVRVAVDDFGTGYTSLEHVQRLPVDLLKIDRAFTGASATPRGFDMLAALLQIGRALGVETICEGVETEAQLATASVLGTTHVQGFLIGRPAPDGPGPHPLGIVAQREPHVLACETALSGRRRHDEA
jgi:diguanylate cyclase (GGDEF)-like protein